MWGTIGEITFEPLAGPESETLQINVDFAEHARIGRKPTQQFTGQKLQTYDLKIKLHQALSDVQWTLETIKMYMENAEILDLYHGDQPDTGIWAGLWIILEMKVTEITRFPDGLIYSADLDLKLKEWVEREELVVSKRKPPPAVRPSAGQKKPSTVTGPGYKDDTLPAPIKV